MSLYLKYRPQDFKTVTGQDHATTTIRNALKRGALTHAYLFCGPRGTGKTSLARIIAKALNCLNLSSDAEPCNACDICEAINNVRLVDLIEIDAASNRGIDEIRDLREKIVFAPSQARNKVYIIDEVHMLTKEAFNALLKTLEEPPSHAYFILATTEAHKIPETIVSRCQQFNFRRIDVASIVARLQTIAFEERIAADEDALELIAKISGGGLRDAIGLFEQMISDSSVKYDKVVENLGLSGSIHVEKFFQYLLERKAVKAIEILQQVNAQGRSLTQFTTELISLLREKMLIGLDRPDEVRAIMHFIDIFSTAKLQIPQAVVPELPLEMGVVRACHFEASPQEVMVKREMEPEALKSGQKTAPKADTRVATGSEDLTLERVRAGWKQVLDKIDTPFIRMSLMDGEPTSYENGTLHLRFNSSTLMQKVESGVNQGPVLKALEDAFGKRIMIKMEVKKVTLTPMVEKDAVKKTPSVVDMAKEVFGIKQD